MEEDRDSHTPVRNWISPIRRAYSPGSGVRDVDSAQRVRRLRAFSWSLVGALLGMLLGGFAVAQGASVWVIPLTLFMGWASSFFGPLLIADMAGRVGQNLYAPSGRSTPRAREYSLAESFIMRGLYEEAGVAFQEAIDEDPTDWQPYVRMARLKRDRTADPEGAAVWFRRALSEPVMPSGPRLLAIKEYVEICERLGSPQRALPILARVADVYPESVEGRWAAEELGKIKQAMSDGERSE